MIDAPLPALPWWLLQVDLSGSVCLGFRCRDPTERQQADGCSEGADLLTPADVVDAESYLPVLDYAASLDALGSHADVCPAPEEDEAYPLINPWNGYQYRVSG